MEGFIDVVRVLLEGADCVALFYVARIAHTSGAIGASIASTIVGCLYGLVFIVDLFKQKE